MKTKFNKARFNKDSSKYYLVEKEYGKVKTSVELSENDFQKALDTLSGVTKSYREQLKEGTQMELKEHFHNDNSHMKDAEKIAADHLREDKNYYNKFKACKL